MSVSYGFYQERADRDTDIHVHPGSHTFTYAHTYMCTQASTRYTHKSLAVTLTGYSLKLQSHIYTLSSDPYNATPQN